MTQITILFKFKLKAITEPNTQITQTHGPAVNFQISMLCYFLPTHKNKIFWDTLYEYTYLPARHLFYFDFLYNITH